MQPISIAIIGDYDAAMYTHVALNHCIDHCRAVLKTEILTRWVPTENITTSFLGENKFQGFWIAPGSPYKNDDGVYSLIKTARENNLPLLGSCGGFQYMVVEYARHVLKMRYAGHEETNADSETLIVSKMSCSLRGQQEEMFIKDRSSWLYKILKTDVMTGKFNCSYGVNPAYQKLIDHHPFVFTAFSSRGEARAVELKTHPFFNGTLFQPPLDSSSEKPNLLILDFLKALATRHT